MARPITYLVLLASLALTTGCPDHVGAGSNPQSALLADQAPTPADELQLRLSSDRNRAGAGEEITLRLTIKNISREALKVDIADLGSNNVTSLSWKVSGPDEDSVRFDQDGFFAIDGRQLSSYPELAPNEERSFEAKISGNPPTLKQVTCSNLPLKPGAQRLQVTYRSRTSAYYDYRRKTRVGGSGSGP